MSIVKNMFGSIITSHLKKEYDNQKFTKFNERPVEFAFVFRMLSRFYPKTLLDVGTGTTALPHVIRNCGMVVTAVDNITDYWPNGMFNRHYYVRDESILAPKHKSKYDAVVCISTLEHIPDHKLAVRNMAEFLNKGGHLIMSFPASSLGYVKDVYQLPNSTYSKNKPYVAQSFSPEVIQNWCSELGLEEVESEYWQFWTEDYWTCGEQMIPPVQTDANGKYQIRCICLRKK